jgi:hypothetical protein
MDDPGNVIRFVISRGALSSQVPQFELLGGKGIRTPGLLIANETLYQLSYTPVWERVDSYIRRRFFASWIWFQSKVQRARPDFKVSDCRSVAARHKNIQTEMLRGRLRERL